MTWLIDATLRASLVLATGLAVAAALRYRPAALRHTVLAGAIVGSALVPAGGLLPVVSVPVRTATVSIGAASQANVAVPGAPTQPSGSRGRVTVEEACTAAWFAGCLILLALFAADAVRVRRIARRAEMLRDVRWRRCTDEIASAFGIRTPVSLLLTDTIDVLATAGVVRPRILLPASAPSWPDDRMRVVLSHELAHIRRRDWAVQVVAEVAKAACWFNPLMWMACRRLRRESEHACDDVVVAGGVPAPDYAAHLLAIARSCRRPAHFESIMTMARPSTLHRRIAVMLNERIDHRPRQPRRAAWIAALAFSAAVSVVVLQAQQGGPGFLAGTVYDPTGAVLPGVTLTLHDANGAERTATTDGAGHFEFAGVAAGRYRLTTALAGFRSLDTAFDLRNRQDWDRALTLQVGDVRETITIMAARAASAQTEAPSTAGPPLRVGGQIRAPRMLKHVRPVYPPEMRAAGREGVVPIEAIIRRDGTVGSVRVLSADVHPDFVIAAVDAVRQWRYSPTLLNGRPVDVVMNVSITFTLSN
ncbi:MAG TPA: M56 family metallopeptidase [Vicinamibacterales bacterium]|nr:M56 family metallopeptidase [Vicinamibacterales bacterium]